MTKREAARIAVVGVGPIGQRHLHAMAAEATTEAVAIVDPSPVGAEIAGQLQLPSFTDLETMLDQVSPDGVIVATPNTYHVPLALRCIARGVPVLVEKPIADTVEGAGQLATAAAAADISVLVGHHRRHNPIIQQARKIVQAGELGQVLAISATWLVRKPDDYFNVTWRHEPGGGPILINLIHDIDNLRFIAGEITAVQGMTSSRARGFAVEDTAAMLLRFESGALATVMLSDKVAAPWSWELTAGERTSYDFPRTGQDCYLFAGTKASLALPSLRMWRHDGAQDWQSPLPETRVTIPEEDPIRRQAAHFAAVIQGRAAPITTAGDATRTLEATLAVRQAAAEGTLVELTP
jgi:predicted dehydrogenase